MLATDNRFMLHLCCGWVGGGGGGGARGKGEIGYVKLSHNDFIRVYATTPCIGYQGIC